MRSPKCRPPGWVLQAGASMAPADGWGGEEFLGFLGQSDELFSVLSDTAQMYCVVGVYFYPETSLRK